MKDMESMGDLRAQFEQGKAEKLKREETAVAESEPQMGMEQERAIIEESVEETKGHLQGAESDIDDLKGLLEEDLGDEDLSHQLAADAELFTQQKADLERRISELQLEPAVSEQTEQPIEPSADTESPEAGETPHAREQIQAFQQLYEQKVESGELTPEALMDQIGQPVELSEEFTDAWEQFTTERDAMLQKYAETQQALLLKADREAQQRQGRRNDEAAAERTQGLQSIEAAQKAEYDAIRAKYAPVFEAEQAGHAEELGRWNAVQFSLERMTNGKPQLIPDTMTFALDPNQEERFKENPDNKKVVLVPKELQTLASPY